MKIHNRDRAIIEFSKITNYLLNPEHKRGGSKETAYGVRYEVIATLQTPSGRELLVRTVWQIDRGTDFPRLTTLVPG
jgi:hypothetical protein